MMRAHAYSAGLESSVTRVWMSRTKTFGLVLMLVGALAPGVASGEEPTFRAEQPIATSQYVKAAIPHDVNGDGRRDVVTLVDTPSAPNTGRVLVMLGNGAGGFAPGTQPSQQINLVATASTMVAGDFNNDRRMDLAVGVVTAGLPTYVPRVVILVGNDAGGFAFSGGGAVYFGAVGSAMPRLVVMDANGDGRDDLLALAPSSEARLFLGRQGSPPTSASAIPLTLSFGNTVVAGDLNADGRGDLVVNRGAFIEVHFAAAGAAPGFEPGVSLPIPASSNSLSAVALVDHNQDGQLDLIATTNRRPELVVGARRGDAWIYRGFAGGGFVPTPRAFELGLSPTVTVRHGDVNGDGFPDVGAINLGVSGSSLAPTNDDGSVAGPVFTSASPTTSDLVVFDMNNDERLDILLVDHDGRLVTPLLNTSTFPGPVATTAGVTERTRRSITVSGSVRTRNHLTRVHVEFGPTTKYGASTAEVPLAVGPATTPVSVTIPDQFAGDTIHYRVVATSRFGTAVGADMTATTVGLVDRVRLRPVWRVGRQLGNIEIRGVRRRSGTMVVTARNAKGTRVMRHRIRLANAGARQVVPLPATLVPGEYQVRLVGPDEAGVSVTHLARLRLVAPRQGYARGVFSRDAGTRALTQLRFGPSSVSVRYQFSHEPLVKPRRIEQRCVTPRRLKVTRRRLYAPLVEIPLSSPAPLPRGRYTCTLHLLPSGLAVAQATLRIR